MARVVGSSPAVPTTLTSKLHKMKISDVLFEKIKVGDKVTSYRGNPGIISEASLGARWKVDPEDVRITIDWETTEGPSKSCQPHLWMDSVEYLG
jgi:hypothetical protein